ncbi:MAG: hypothetical protein JO243_07975 [Solirubrobacterales bacterium]|nr:hypothetical protein [Solirubrobacterales bacterium]MBV9335819.1 hypothetical protein [Solirubrobacterales bacterium]
MRRDPVDRPEDERDEDERDEVERDELGRAEAEREPAARDPFERDVFERLVVRELLRAEPEPERVLRDERDDDAFACEAVLRTLSKSLSACLLVFAALRRSAPSAAVTSL